MNKIYDVAVVGAGIIGMATAHYLAANHVNVAVIERKHIGSGSTGRCIGGIRQQFSTPASIRLMKESMTLFAQMEEEFGHPVEFHRGGYLFLAHNQRMKEIFETNIAVQQKEGLNVSLLTPGDIQKLVPHLVTEHLTAGAYCPDDAQAFPFPVLDGYRKKIIDNNGTFHFADPVTSIKKERHFHLQLQSGTHIEAEKVLLCAGPWTGQLAAPLGIELPLYPERHEAAITERIPKFFGPMIVDYREDGCYFHQLAGGQVIGCYSPIPNVPGIHDDVTFNFLTEVSRRMCRLIPKLCGAAMLRSWSGSYTMTPDGNPIVDHSDLDNLYIASGMSGHGFMFGPAIGKHLALFMTDNQWKMDFSEFALHREYKSKENMK